MYDGYTIYSDGHSYTMILFWGSKKSRWNASISIPTYLYSLTLSGVVNTKGSNATLMSGQNTFLA